MKLLVSLVFLGTTLGVAADQAPWRPFDVKADREAALVSTLETQGVTAIGWSNAVVEVSDFQPVVTVPLATLSDRLTAQDPRWDPWLAGLASSFHPREGVSRLWVAPGDEAKARDVLGAEASSPGVPWPGDQTQSHGAGPRRVTPRQVTGWTLVLFSLLYLVFRGVTGVLTRGPWTRAWVGFAVPVAVLAVGVALTLGPVRWSAPAPGTRISWTQHLWFQQSWPYGATWKDWKPGKPWTYLRYERSNGKIAAVETSLPAPDQAWSQAAFSALDAHGAARIFGFENP